MRKIFTLASIVLLFICSQVLPAMGFNIIDLQDSLYVKSIGAMQITDFSDPSLRIIMTLQNDSDKTVRIKNGEFKIYITPNKNYKEDALHSRLGENSRIIPQKSLEVGMSKVGVGNEESSYIVTRLSSFEIGKTNSKTAIFEIPLPKIPKERYELVKKLVNIIGLPGSFKKIEMVGKATIGINGARGWTYQDMSLLELSYVPQIQSEVLFQ